MYYTKARPRQKKHPIWAAHPCTHFSIKYPRVLIVSYRRDEVLIWLTFHLLVFCLAIYYENTLAVHSENPLMVSNLTTGNSGQLKMSAKFRPSQKRRFWICPPPPGSFYEDNTQPGIQVPLVQRHITRSYWGTGKYPGIFQYPGFMMSHYRGIDKYPGIFHQIPRYLIACQIPG